MKQFSSLLYKEEDLALCLQEAKGVAASMAHISDLLVTLFASELSVHTMADFERATRRIFPQAKVVGFAAECGFANGKMWSGEDDLSDAASASVTFTFFSSSRVIPLAFDGASNVLSAARGLMQTISQEKAAKAVGLFLAAQVPGITELLDALSEADEEIVFFGGLLSEQTDGRRIIIDVAGHRMSRGFLALVFAGEELHVKALPSFGWKPFGPEAQITRMADERTIVELDEKPASEFFSHYLGIRHGWDSLASVETFPMCLKRNGTTLARRLMDIHGDGCVYVSADLAEGERLRIASGDPIAIISEAQRAHAELCDFSPEAVFIVNCMGHYVMLQQNNLYEYAAISHAVPTQGFYSFAEFFRNKGRFMKTNLMMVSVGFREGEPKEAPIYKPVSPQFGEQTSIIAHLVHFVDAMTKEWESAHSKLVVLAERDALTGLMNRRAMERSFKDILHDALASDIPFAVMMLDMDDFKGINDTFGHAMGDEALVALADILRSSVRSVDIVSRWGGDEFFVILTHADREAAGRVVERIHRGASSLSLLMPDHRPVGLSIGVTLSRAHDTPETVFQRADAALYESKRTQGKNKVTYR
ncbi:MAG: diguanylate cyclase domain-containing protein [Selenomonas sp.]